MAVWLTLLTLSGAPESATDLLDRTRELTSVSARCQAPQPGEVLVCARRRADAYRLPFVEHVPGTRADPTPDQRVAAIAPRSNCENLSPFLVGCGSFGVGVAITSDGAGRTFTPRERTPDIAR